MTQGKRISGSSPMWNDPDILEDDYFRWLAGKAGGWDQLSLLAVLHSIPFTWSVCNDSNREDDGSYQRWIFHEETGKNIPKDYARGSGCSVLEMMVGMASAMHEFMYEPENGSCTQIWFQGFLYNMGIGYLTDTVFQRNPLESEEEAMEAVRRLLERDYARDGVGGMFPVPGSTEDIREMELWYQMNLYCNAITDGNLQESTWE